MAEAFFEDLAKGRYRAESAGTIPADLPHQEVVESMKQVGLDLPQTAGRLLTQELTDDAHLVIGMGCAVEEACPALRVPLEDWELDDPKGKSPDEVAAIRDLIELKVRNLIGRLDRESA
jgi:arsenate reductase